jgi:putative ABC transport system permease protein
MKEFKLNNLASFINHMLVIRLILESFRFAFGALKGNLLRTTLSLLGVTIGIFAIILVYTIVDSLEKGFRTSFSFVGENVLYVEKWPWIFANNYPWWKYLGRPETNYKDFKYLESKITKADGVAIFARRQGVTFKSANNSMQNVNLQGVSFEYNRVAEVPVEKGRYFSMQEVDAGRNVAIIGADIAANLFPNADPIGKDIKVKGLKFIVVGVMEKQGTNFLEGVPSNDLICHIPYLSFQKIFYSGLRGGAYSIIAVKGMATDPGMIEVENELRGLMRQKRGLKPIEEDDFAINRPEMLAKAITAIFDVLNLAGNVIGSFSILVGGFGIANIMFVSVKERTNLIGIQKSLGAKNYFILFQFLFEAIFLCLIGALVGILIVYLITFASLGSLELELSAKNVIWGVGIASFIGVLAGIVPAVVAARLDPVTAIRSK